MIDLDYAILELMQSTCQPCARDAHRANIRQLTEQRDRLREFSDGLVDSLRAGDGQAPTWASTWWPDFTRRSDPDHATGRSSLDDAAL